MEPRAILFIEVDEHLRQMTAAMLERAGFNVLQAGDVAEASEVWQQEQGSIDLVLTDIIIPGLSGPEIAPEFFPPRPNLKLIYASREPEEKASQKLRGVKGGRFLKKPYGIKALLDTIHSCFEEHGET
jgi:two-component system cell cycle sensor histidine kinase/response regulator CckA